ncbi:hypothetical protein OHT76_04220 [Streptomyces sp. NBC_00287]|uniref:hypothetical protein n=1 Tax=Streptomyces sp. NBC_00287 TaxID=2975702 RepID=UPI002E28116F|nr:hypothetical protein [Streptomyces sp. NBC_00287]
MRTNRNRTTLTVAALAAGLALTACGSSDQEAAGDARPSATASASAMPSASADLSGSGKSPGSGGPSPSEATSQGSTGGGTEGSEDPEGTIEGVNKGKGVNGTWLGQVRYLAPGKFTISDLKGTEQQFFLAADTEIWGYGVICGDSNTGEGGQGGIECTEAELERAAKGDRLSAEVVVANGIATKITEDH